MTSESCPRTGPCPRVMLVAQLAALVTGLFALVVGESPRWQVAADTGNWAGLLIDFNLDTTLPALVFLLLPVCWFVGRHPVRTPAETPDASNATTPDSRPLRDLLASLLVAGLSLAASLWVATRGVGPEDRYEFGTLPPAYHDEFSYLLMAETFLDCRTSYPSPPEETERFTQIHVLNEGRFASRYFPSTGAWIAPFLAVGHPVWGHWLAGALSAVLMFWSGKELGGFLTGVLAGVLTALAPGLALFSNLLLAHHPTLLGLALFTYCFLRMMRTHSILCGFLAGTGLAFAMLARPMSAAGYALPFGVWLLYHLAAPGMLEGGRRTAWKLNLAVGAPILAGILSLAAYSMTITGDPLDTPYALYLRTYTPRHVYGFDNVVRGDRVPHKMVFEKYDLWARNLTPAGAQENVRVRLLTTWQWTAGIVPMTMAAVFFVIALRHLPDRRWVLVPASIVTMHLAHIPYWYEGILGWHYVFESALTWLLMTAGASAFAIRWWLDRGRPALAGWWLLLLVATLWPCYFAGGESWPVSRLGAEIDGVAFSRLRFQRFDDELAQQVGPGPAAVLIHHDPYDIHIDYVQNHPGREQPILRLRSDAGFPTEAELAALRQSFPDRSLWYFDAATGRLSPIR